MSLLLLGEHFSNTIKREKPSISPVSRRNYALISNKMPLAVWAKLFQISRFTASTKNKLQVQCETMTDPWSDIHVRGTRSLDFVDKKNLFGGTNNEICRKVRLPT